MNIPTDYITGYGLAHKVAPEMAANYMNHTHIGDPLAAAMTEDLAELGTDELSRLIQTAMENPGEGAL